MVIKMLAKLRLRMGEHSENFNKGTNYKREFLAPKNTITEMKTTLEGMNSRLGDAGNKSAIWKPGW